MNVIFDVLHLYYLPQYLPVLKTLQAASADVHFVFYKQGDEPLNQVCREVIEQEKLTATWVDDWEEALAFYLSQKADWLIFGNKVANLDELHAVSKTVMMQHGIGPKRCYYQNSESPTTVRFIEGQHRLKRLLDLYPDGSFIDTGYAKLDPLFQQLENSMTLESLGLDPSKKTILYAPTFYPSSIECFSKKFAKEFADFNIILKPHFFSLTKKKYHKQRKLLENWATHDNVYLATVSDYNLIPFMAISDLMLSDASSAIFEFAALGKPVVWCDFYKLRWSYRGIFKYRFDRRIDEDIQYFNQVAYRAADYSELVVTVRTAVDAGVKAGTADVIEKLAGSIDGHCSNRIVEYLLANTKSGSDS
ncbi:CDP-glycerol glycerophosphotransferase family protein [Psychrosphaera algicola]|uniref:CDP-glycerol glycerophosphotransferase family protein n=1 Tax=Psychrosphaera algicola TaxID=3023714 RepID=A0ABT5FDU1_9GAMM|nr:CDP-glycerol glycerophosphotransferase family protein [Psychrosphaera sp. G1-22]MDC2889511.1 CDP-glycerol glycerophosphotransferase family protein [Psychrosphaera sp. G1-22]